MKYKVAELEGAQLDAAVAKAEGKQWESQIYGPDRDDWYVSVDGARFAPSQEWDQGGPIIERELIEWEVGDAPGPGHVWYAKLSPFNEPFSDSFKGPTPLIAAMRAYVASKFGEEVDLP
jgi:hypothetical protein